MKIKPCEVCGEQFNNVFDMIDHLSDGEGEPYFDPTLVLPSGHKLLVGTLLRIIYDHSNKPSQVRDITSGAFMTLYLAETEQKSMRENVTEVVVDRFMKDLDAELKNLLEEDNDK
jgi:hypothetical protein